MNETTDTYLESLLNDRARALELSGSMVNTIRLLKVSLMKRHLGCERTDDMTGEYRAGFPSSQWKTVPLGSLLRPGGIAEGAEDESIFTDDRTAEGLPLIRARHIRGLKIDPGTLDSVSAAAGGGPSARGGDIVLRIHGEDRGASAIVPLVLDRAFAGAGLLIMPVDHGACESFYLLNVLHFWYNTGIIGELLTDDPARSLAEAIVPAPPREKQKQVADTMLALSALVNVQERYRAELAAIEGVASLFERI